MVERAEEASHSWGETFGDQKRHRLVCGKLLENLTVEAIHFHVLATRHFPKKV